jgi:hypothetical protein
MKGGSKSTKPGTPFRSQTKNERWFRQQEKNEVGKLNFFRQIDNGMREGPRRSSIKTPCVSLISNIDEKTRRA